MSRIVLLPKLLPHLIAGILLLYTISSCVVYYSVERLDNESHDLMFPSVAYDSTTSKGFKVHRHRTHPAASPVETKSDQRDEYETTLDESRIPSTVKAMRTKDQIQTVVAHSMTYNIYRCPPTPPDGYPFAWSILDVLSHWNPDDTNIPKSIYQGLCVFDWTDPKQQAIADTYRKAELPFVVNSHPEIWKTAERWSHTEYLSKMLGKNMYRNEFSHDNHMMYWKLRGNQRVPDNWKPPTDNVELSFEEWYKKAEQLEEMSSTTNSVDHWYLRLNGSYKGDNEFLYDELPLFNPRQPSLFMVNPHDERGINCRFGMTGVIAETHYDFSRNWIFILGGAKRYILAHPKQCSNMELYPQGHPSARHSSINWSNPKEWHTGNLPKAQVQEVVLQAGDALYIPTAWFHFIVSLNRNYQCNARSGITNENKAAIVACGF
jgi:hypothetical protein